MFLAQKDNGLSLVVDERVGVLSLKLVDELDDVAVAMLAKVFGAQVFQLMLALDVVDADFGLLHQFLHEKNTLARYALREHCRYGCTSAQCSLREDCR